MASAGGGRHRRGRAASGARRPRPSGVDGVGGGADRRRHRRHRPLPRPLPHRQRRCVPFSSRSSPSRLVRSWNEPSRMRMSPLPSNIRPELASGWLAVAQEQFGSNQGGK